MDKVRRTFVNRGASVALFGVASPLLTLSEPAGAQQAAPAPDWAQGVFGARSLLEAVRAMGGNAVIETRDVSWGNTPDIAENGLVVPISISTTLAGVESVGLFIEKNPTPMAALFEVPAGTRASFRTNFKLGESSNVYALVKAEGRVLVARHEIKVTIGGCGG
jgi:sulfur-oxidizing protein SoxY